jgi:hypothetical protein
MSATEDSQNGSNGNELNVLVAALGLTGNSRYVQDIEALADKAESAVKSIAGINGRRVDTVVVRENYELCQVLQDRMDGEAFPDVQYYGLDWRQMLDDTDATDKDGEVIAKGVMQEDDDPVADIMAAKYDSVDPADFDLDDRDNRDDLDMDLIDQDRINRAKARARGKTDERLYNTFFDSAPDVTEAVFLNDGTNRGMAALEAARGINPFVKYPTECAGSVLEVSCNKDGEQIIDWARYLLETGEIEADELTDDQEERLRATYSDDDLEYMGLEVAPEPASTSPDRAEVAAAEAQAVTGGEASAD